MALHQRSNGRDQLRQRGTQRHEGQRDDRFRHAHRLRDEGTVVHQQVRAQRDEGCAHHQQQDDLSDAHRLFLMLRLCRGIFHLPDIRRHIGHKHPQHQQAHRTGKAAHAVSCHAVDGRSRKEESHRNTQGLRVHLAGPHGHRNGRDEGRVADDRADGVAVGDLAVAGHCRDGGHHHLGQGSADGHHRCADEQLRQMELAGQRRCAVHEPVTALDKAEQSQKKQDAGDYHIVPPNISPGANRAASHNKSRIVYDTKFPCGIQRPARKHFEPRYIRWAVPLKSIAVCVIL